MPAAGGLPVACGREIDHLPSPASNRLLLEPSWRGTVEHTDTTVRRVLAQPGGAARGGGRSPSTRASLRAMAPHLPRVVAAVLVGLVVCCDGVPGDPDGKRKKVLSSQPRMYDTATAHASYAADLVVNSTHSQLDRSLPRLASSLQHYGV